MELKTYQDNVLRDLKDYLSAVDRTNDIVAAWHMYWTDKDVAVGGDLFGVPEYHNDLPGVPHVCMKVPTGGGKTFLACSAARRIFAVMPSIRPKVLIWLVPSDAILTQTVKNLSNPNHPYRQRLDADFHGRVEVYEKEQLLNAQNFSPDTVREVLTICVLTFGSLRIESKKKDDRKVFQENGNLQRFSEKFRDETSGLVPLPEVPDTALVNVLRQFSPVVVVDESHNAKSTLSVQMLHNLNPGFVLDLTATPTANANVISYVKAIDLKKEHMVKLPVFVYNRADRSSVVRDALQLRGRLEQLAHAERKKGGRYIRPILLFQAQPNVGEDNATFDKLRTKLVELGIAENQIAVKTSSCDELGKINLLDPKCEIRYIITVNALKEGWDCPFAYVLASLANKSSTTDVEQIVGRILRHPYATPHENPLLNCSYLLSCSSDFQHTIASVVKGLNDAGFSQNDYRTASDVTASGDSHSSGTVVTECQSADQTGSHSAFTAENPFSDIRLSGDQRPGFTEVEGLATEDAPQELNAFFDEVAAASAEYDEQASIAHEDNGVWLAQEGPSAKPARMQTRFRDEVSGLKIPQFFIKSEADMFGEGKDLLSPENLAEGFSLVNADAHVDFSFSFDQAGRIDVEESGDGVPRYRQLSSREREYISRMMQGECQERKLLRAADILYGLINRFNDVDPREIKPYVKRVLQGLDQHDIDALDQVLPALAERIHEKIDSLKADHCFRKFREGLDTSEIVCDPNYQLPTSISPVESTSLLAKSLYDAEYADMTSLEQDAITAIAGLDNVKWWHRIRDRRGFCLNGFINHYPDFMIMTHSGTLVLVETKGDFLDNADSRRKLELGRAWQNATDNRYKYFMVYKDRELQLDGAYPLAQFLNVLKEL